APKLPRGHASSAAIGWSRRPHGRYRGSQPSRPRASYLWQEHAMDGPLPLAYPPPSHSLPFPPQPCLPRLPGRVREAEEGREGAVPTIILVELRPHPARSDATGSECRASGLRSRMGNRNRSPHVEKHDAIFEASERNVAAVIGDRRPHAGLD